MKARGVRVQEDDNHSFRVFTQELPYHHKPFHYHKEIEIVYILKGYGTRFIGDSVEPFGVDDVVLIGENLPHCFKDDPIFFEPGSELKAQSLVVQFSIDFAGKLFEIKEFGHIQQLLSSARKGLKFHGSVKAQIKTSLENIANCTGSKRVITLIELLEVMANSEAKEVLNPAMSIKINQENLDRLNAVFEYTVQNLDKKITLEEISAIANLSANAFCRYFKQRTRKSYTDFVNDLRISKICQSMKESNLNISEIAYAHGFNNLAHFIKTFKKKMGMPPFEYKKHLAELHKKSL